MFTTKLSVETALGAAGAGAAAARTGGALGDDGKAGFAKRTK